VAIFSGLRNSYIKWYPDSPFITFLIAALPDFFGTLEIHKERKYTWHRQKTAIRSGFTTPARWRMAVYSIHRKNQRPDAETSAAKIVAMAVESMIMIAATTNVVAAGTQVQWSL
jgi:hypothetical protein